jgi:hypothetical protein
MLTGAQLIKKLTGQLKVDEAKVKKFSDEFTKEFPKGELTISRDSYGITVRCRIEHDIPICMKCGQPMIDRINQYRKNGKWVFKARKDNISNWECTKCYPNGHAPLLISAGIGED